MAATSFFGGAFFGGEFFNTPAPTTTRHPGIEPRHDPRIMRDDEEMMKNAVLFITLIDP